MINRLKLARRICRFFPPIIAQRLRTIIFPRSLSIQEDIPFLRKSITGSFFKGTTKDFHAYPFAVHGFFEWRNVLVCSVIMNNSEGGDIVEIGANVGTETISYCDLLKEGYKVHAFEPVPANLSYLEKQFNNNNHLEDKLVIYDEALSDNIGETTFMLPSETASGNGTIVKEDYKGKSIKVKVNMLDNFKDRINNLKLITLDTEGHEYLVLKGGGKIIKDKRPAVLLEVNSNLIEKFTKHKVRDLKTFFDTLEYKCYSIERFHLKEILVSTDLNQMNKDWICLPKEKNGISKKINQQLLKYSIFPLTKI